MLHQATRSIVSGGGFVRSDGFRFSQKIDGLRQTKGYGFFGSMFREDSYHGSRFEDRCGDINLSDWAAWQHVGGMAIAIAISRTPLISELPDINPEGHSEHKLAKLLNGFKVSDRGVIKSSPRSFLAVDFQQAMAEIAMDKLMFYSDELPQELFLVAKSLHTFCERYRSLLSGNLSIETFSEQADWAVKLQYILESIKRDSGQFGIKRTLTDLKARQIDMLYDSRRFTAIDGAVIEKKESLATKLNRRGIIKDRVPKHQIQNALRNAPQNTRAHLRGQLIRNYHVDNIDWHYVTISDNSRSHKITIDNVTQTTFDGETQEKISEIKQK
jgi:hypothetical protein